MYAERMQLWQLRRKVHSSWLIAFTSAGIVVGTAIVPYSSQTVFASPLYLFAAMIVIAVILWQRFTYLIPVVIIAGLVIGLWRGSVQQSQLAFYKKLVGHQIHISGTVSDDPDVGKHGEMLL